MTRSGHRTYVAVAAVILVLLSGCARRPVGRTTAAPPPTPEAGEVVAGAEAGAAAGPQETPIAPRSDTPIAQASPEPDPPAAVAPPAPEAVVVPTEAPAEAVTPPAAESAAAPDMAPAPPEVLTEAVTPPAAESVAAPDMAPAPPEAAPANTAPAEVQVAAAAPPAVESPAPAPAVEEFRPIQGLNDVHFDFDEYAIRPGDAKILDENAAWLNANERYLVLIEGHADERGTSEYNLALGEHRAKAAMRYLGALGIRASRMTIISYGKERPVCLEREERCWARNRRAHILVKPQ